MILLITKLLHLPHGLERGAGGQGFFFFYHRALEASTQRPSCWGDNRGRSLSVRLWPLASWEAGEKADPRLAHPQAMQAALVT